MIILLKKKRKFGTRKVAQKKHININQEVNFQKNVVVHIQLHLEMDGQMIVIGLKNKDKVGTKILAWKKQENINQEVNFRKNVEVHIKQQEEMDGQMTALLKNKGKFGIKKVAQKKQ